MTLLVVMGSGETAPAMRRVHREVFAATGEGKAVMLDTPFGFQENADELTARTRAYFAESVGRKVEVAHWRTAAAPAAQRETALAVLAEAGWVFAGPGSPTYALGQWLGTPVPGALIDVVRRGGTLVFGSAGAVTLGTHAIPVYEIYKVGAPAHWVQGLDLLGQLTGIRAALVPHYDNAEGATHDTRFCYLGERRLAVLETELPADVGVLGVDEHTALVLDLDEGTAGVRGLGGATVRRDGRSMVVPTGESVPLGELAAMLRGERGLRIDGPSAPLTASSDATGPPPHASVRSGPDQGSVADAASLREEAQRAREAYDVALAARDVDGCVGAILGLEQAIVDWAADTLQSDDTDAARRALRAMIVGLGELARLGARDPREVLGPIVELALGLRASAREANDFATSDLVRERLAEAGITVRDTATGTQWTVTR